jgi:carboxyl-terminal processing protease
MYWDEETAGFVRQMVEATYVDPVSPEKSRELFDKAMHAYLSGLPDEYNDYIPPDQYRKWKDETAGRYAGIGVKVDPKPDGLLLAGVFPGGPAAKSGLRVGDLVTHVDGRSLAGVDPTRDLHVKMLKGPAGTSVTVTVRSPLPVSSAGGAAAKPATPPAAAPPAPGAGGFPPAPPPSPAAPAAPAPEPRSAPRQVAIVRDFIKPQTVFPRRLGEGGRVGYLRVTEFADATAADFDRELDEMVRTGVQSVIVDLRDNTGGVLPATERMADRFVRSGLIVRLEGRAPHASRLIGARDAGTIPDAVGLVVLVNGSSASASEVFSGCVQDHRRGVLVGTRTYGKFLVQNITEIPGKGAAVKLTTARYKTPLGRSYKRSAKDPGPAGLLPDVLVELSKEDAERLEKAFANQEDAAWGAKPRAENAAVPGDWIDPQLARAIDVALGRVVVQEMPGNAPKKG